MTIILAFLIGMVFGPAILGLIEDERRTFIAYGLFFCATLVAAIATLIV